MRTVKSLLLATAAALVAGAAQSADITVKAKPVQHVKICSLHGDGFYYIPGTDTCLKLGGYVRVQAEYNAGGGGVADGTLSQLAQGQYDRVRTNDVDYRIRGALSLDARNQTEYGTLRSYVRIGIEQATPSDSTSGAVYWDRAFIQFAGFTVGKAQSFFDTVTFDGVYTYHKVRTVSDTTTSGWNVWAYTAQFGNGYSATLSLEDPNRNRSVVDNTMAGSFPYGGAALFDNAFGAQSSSNNGMRMPDVIANLRIDQAWGYASVSAALHDVAGAYFGTANNVNAGHPADKKGWAVGAGAVLNLPGGDKLGINAQYSEGASGYGAAATQNWSILKPGVSAGAGWAADGVFGTGTEIELTRVWNAIAFYQHIWNPHWRTSWYGGYVGIDYNAGATRLINPAAVCGGTGVVLAGVTPLAGNSCNPDFSFYQVGTRTQWNPVPLLDIGLDVLYTRLNTAYKGPATVVPGAPQQTVTRVDDQGVWSVLFRWQRNFYP